MLAGVKAMETPLLPQIEKFGHALTIIILAFSVLLFAYGMLVKGFGFVDMFKAVVGVAVSAIPEGLPAVITITLAIGVQRMAWFLLESSLSLDAFSGNRWVPISIGAVIVLQALFTYFPPMQDISGVEAVPLSVWKWLLLGGAIFFLIVELEKFIIRQMGSQSEEPAPA